MQFNHLAIKLQKISLLTWLLILTFLCTIAYGEIQPQSTEKELEAWQEALLYSKAHPVIAFAVYGRTEKSTAKENADKIQAYFSRHNVQSYYFLAKVHEMKSAVEFFIQGVPYGPVGLAKALPLIQQVTAHYKEEYLGKQSAF